MLKTEMRNPASMHLDRMDTLSMLRLINRENARAVEAVEEALPAIARAVDAVTAEVAQLDFGMMQHIVNRITHEVSGVNRVLWDLTPKPTGTIEWE